MYVYIIRSKTNPNQHYVGKTKDPKARLKAHNEGKTKSTKKFVPWEYVNIFWFKDKTKADNFELYLKSGSGIAFRKKRFLGMDKKTYL